MAALSGLRTLVWTYLGTTSSDPAYPAASVTALINAAAGNLIADVHQAKPDYLRKYTTLSAAGRSYTLPSDFAGWLEVRTPTGEGTLMTEVRREELFAASGYPAFSITGPDGSAILETGTGVDVGATIYLLYRYTPTELAADADTPSWLPTPYHDLLARLAAIDAFGIGGESAPSPTFVRTTQDRLAQFWAAISRRGIAPTVQR